LSSGERLAALALPLRARCESSLRMPACPTACAGCSRGVDTGTEPVLKLRACGSGCNCECGCGCGCERGEEDEEAEALAAMEAPPAPVAAANDEGDPSDAERGEPTADE